MAVQDLIVKQTTTAATEAGVNIAPRWLALDDLRSRLIRAIAAGQPPDLALVGSGDPALLAARGFLVNVRDALERIAGLNGELFPPLQALASAGPFVDRPPNQRAPVWAIPYTSMGSAWLVRQDLLARKSLALPKTFEDVRSIADKLTNQSNSAFGWTAGLPVSDAVDDLARVALLDYGAPLFDALGLRIVLNTDAAAAGIQAIANLYRRDDGSPLAPANAVDSPPSQVKVAFASGTVAQTIDFGGLYAQITLEQPTLQKAIVALPSPSGPKGWSTSVPSTFFVVTRKGKAPDKAVAFIERLLQPDRYEALVRAGRGSVIPPYAYLTKGPFWDEDPNYPVFAANARGDPARNFSFAPLGYPAPPTLPAVMIQTSHVLANAIRAVAAGGTPSNVAVATMLEQCQRLARDAFALQPTPTSTPLPFWLQLLGPTPTPR
jgi:ABC-type glycerol-3-phosphate transport system substrate-binding protein